MNKIAEQKLEKKITLIYEYNKKTPLFVRIANKEIELQNIQHAIDILESGLEIFPNYPVALLLLGKAFSLNGNYDKALDFFKKGSELIESDDTFDSYRKEIESLKKQRTLSDTVRNDVFSDYKADDFQSKLDAKSKERRVEDKSISDFTQSIDDKLDQLAKEISKAKISISSQSEFTDSEFLSKLSSDNLIISETLAKIYFAQEEYSEAIQVYEKLIKNEPAKYEYYTKKINEIRLKMKT